MSIIASALSLAVLCWRRSGAPYGDARYARPRYLGLAVCVALAGPLVAVVLSTLLHGHVSLRDWDSPSRFLLAVPLFLALRRAPQRVFARADLSFTLGALSTLVIILFMSRDWGDGRVSSKFLNPIHFGDIALAFAVLSALSLNWWRKDPVLLRVLKIAGIFAGLAVSLLTGSRGGWAAIPPMAVLILWERGRGKSLRWNVLAPVAVAALLALVYGLSGSVRERVDMVSSDLAQYTRGERDTAVGIRLQLYDVAFTLIRQHPVLGLGGEGFRNAMPELARQGALTPLAAQFGIGETHNQLLAYTVNFGIVGGIALLGIYVVPALFFARRLGAASGTVRRTALMGLSFVLMFFIFGLTVETFDLKGTVAFYATMVAVLLAITDRADAVSTA
ncbi:O-antigen ligase family protein [Paraburkholderia denitrificans]|uniref:O-antigen ligase family protein n=1 Tax=Paraburkholderia denitrificans TaxID=694025 RepID=A0ABW0JBL6_9BURK